MKKVVLLTIIVIICKIILAQVPESFNYLAIPHNSNNGIYSHQPMNIRISILSGSPTGSSIYTETYSQTTTSLGLLNLQIGKGIPVLGNFTAIKWDAGLYYLRIEIDTADKVIYSSLGTTQILHGPNGFYTKPAESPNRHYKGEKYGGGIVFYVDDNGQHGLIATTTDQSRDFNFWLVSPDIIIVNGDGIGVGFQNTVNMGRSFVEWISNRSSVTVDGIAYEDWYLPSKYELHLLYLAKTLVGGFKSDYYWSSTVDHKFYMWVQDFSNGVQTSSKYPESHNSVRVIRSF